MKPKKDNKDNKEEDKEEMECKICFDAKAEYINEQCGHLFMCGGCVKSITKGSARGSCPVCKTIGQFFKYKTPIYS